MFTHGKFYVDKDEFISYITIAKYLSTEELDIGNYKENLIELEMVDFACMHGLKVYLTEEGKPVSYIIYQDNQYDEIELKHSKNN